jgi:hypothetical protein
LTLEMELIICSKTYVRNCYCSLLNNPLSSIDRNRSFLSSSNMSQIFPLRVTLYNFGYPNSASALETGDNSLVNNASFIFSYDILCNINLFYHWELKVFSVWNKKTFIFLMESCNEIWWS